MYESSAANPLYQSADLDWDAARAEWERQGEGADRLPACDVCERTPARRCKHDNLLLCKTCETSSEHAEYCAEVKEANA
jgi:hypothetical protein